MSKKLIIYSSFCYECVRRDELKTIKEQAAMFGYTVEVKRTVLSREVQAEARRVSTIQVPFIYNPDTGLSCSTSQSIVDIV